MRIGQHSPAIPDKSTQVRETASPATQKTAPAAPLPSTPPTAGAGLPPVQSQFSAPVRHSASAKGSGFVTPPPPGKGKAGAKASADAKVNPDQMKLAMGEAFEMVYGRQPDASDLQKFQDKAQKLVDAGEDFNSVKFGIHAEMLSAKTGKPVATPAPSGAAGNAVTDSIKQSVFGGAMGMPSSMGSAMSASSATSSAASSGKTDASSASSTSGASSASSKPSVKLNPEQMKLAMGEAFEMVHGRQPNANELKKFQDKAQKLVDAGEDFNSVKFGIHAEILSAKTGKPVATPAPSGSAGNAVTDSIKQSIFGSAMGMPSSMGSAMSASSATSSAASSGKTDASSASSTSSKPSVKLNPEQMKLAMGEAFEMVHGRQPDASELKKFQDKAQKLVNAGEDFNSVKFGIHAEILSAKTGKPVATPAPSGAAGDAATDAIKQSVFGGAMGMPSSMGASSALFGKAATVKASGATSAQSQGPLRQAVDDMHQLVFGMKASGASAQELMTHAQGLSGKHGNDAGALRTALHSLMTGKSAEGSPAPLSKDRLTQAVNEAHQLVFGAHPSAAKALGLMGRAMEMASQLKNDFHALKFALHSQMSGKPMPAPGAAHPPPTDTQLRQTLDDAHQVAFKQAAGGPHLGAWMDEARQLASQHGNDMQAVKLALHSRMLEAK